MDDDKMEPAVQRLRLSPTDRLLNRSGWMKINSIYKLCGSKRTYDEWRGRQVKMGAAKRKARMGKDEAVNQRREAYGGLWDN